MEDMECEGENLLNGVREQKVAVVAAAVWL